MLSVELKNKLISFFNLDRDEYRESHEYSGLDEYQHQNITNTAKQVIKIISSFSDSDGKVTINEMNVVSLWECVNALEICMYPQSSWNREATVLLVYQFLHNFRWAGAAPKYFGYDGWGPLIYTLSSEQLAYYLWWREEAKNGTFHEATGEYLWLYIYDIVLNTCYNDSTQSLFALQKLYDSYDRLSPTITHKRLSHTKLGFFIVNYALYNGLTLDINRLIEFYGVDDTFNIYHRISAGNFKGSENLLLTISSSAVKTKTFENSDEQRFVRSVIAPIFEQVSKICKSASVNLLGDICGTLNTHALWAPYESPVLYARSVAKTVASNIHVSFTIGENPYIYATDDLSSDRELVNKNGSFYYNDNGSRFHRVGFYYRKEYSGVNETGRQVIDYVIRKIQISYRSILGGRSIKELVCPYKEIKSEIDHTIATLVHQYYPSWQQVKKMTTPMLKLEYKILPENQIKIPSKFRYRRSTSINSRAKTQARGENVMSKIQKASILQEKFDILKDQYSRKDGDSNVLYTISDNIIVPMLGLDFEAGCKMWEYMLHRYYGKCYPVDYTALTNNVVEQTETKILVKVFQTSEQIKKYVFLLDPYEGHLYCEWFIRDLILSEEYDLADELITLFSRNNHGENDPKENLYSVLNQAVNSSETRWKINPAGIDFLSRWIAKIESATKKAELEVALLFLIDCVEGNEPKGSMPFNMFMAEGGIQMLMEDRLKIKDAQNAEGGFNKLIKASSKNTSIKPEKVQTKERRQESAQQPEMFDVEGLEQSLLELNSLIGLQRVKEEITSLTNLMRIRRIRSERGMKAPDTSQHLVFSGNPGTGKTTVARIVSKVYHALGFLSKGHLVEVDRSGLVAGYVGQTAIKTQEVIQSALGGVLFIDEAYSLSPERGENDFGQEAIDTILKAMEDHRDDFVVIVAGYDSLMSRFIDSNPGLKSRFNKYILFPDYNGAELFCIFKTFLERNDYVIDESAARLVATYLDNLYRNRDESFGNARDVRNLFEKVIANQANRLMNDTLLSDDRIARITVEDLQNIV